jgi:endonuclease YncB( thermonuclease family)
MSLFTVLFLIPPAACDDQWARVRWVADGDTVILTDGRHIRYIGINAPEVAHKDKKAEPFGYAAKKFNGRLVKNKEIRLVFDRERQDRYGRFLAYVYLPDGRFVNALMVANGLAYCLPKRPNTRHSAMLLKRQREAMTAGLGMWKEWNEEPDRYIGNRKSKRFHAKTCRMGKKTGKRNRTIFRRKWDAFWAGFAPARKCLGPK